MFQKLICIRSVSTGRDCWILFWRDGRPDHFYAPYAGHESVPDFIKFKEDKMTLFLSDINDIYKSPEE